MSTPFDDLPFNELKAYVAGTTPTGCKIYVPVLFNNDEFMRLKKEALQKYLNIYCDLPEPPEPMTA